MAQALYLAVRAVRVKRTQGVPPVDSSMEPSRGVPAGFKSLSVAKKHFL